MNSTVNIVEIFYSVDEFCKNIYPNMMPYQIDEKGAKKRRKRRFKLNDS